MCLTLPVRPLRLALLALRLYFPSCLLLGQRSYVVIDDHLDPELTTPYSFTCLRLALGYGPALVLAPTTNGLSRNAVRPGLSATIGLFHLVDPCSAYLLHQLLARLLHYTHNCYAPCGH